MNVEDAVDGLVHCLRVNLTDPENRASASYWIDDSWVDERLRKYGWPQISLFEVGATSEEARKGYLVYYPVIQVDVFASGKKQKQQLADEVKDAFLNNRESLNASGINFLGLSGESDVIEDERVPLKAYRKTMVFRVMIYSSG